MEILLIGRTAQITARVDLTLEKIYKHFNFFLKVGTLK